MRLAVGLTMAMFVCCGAAAQTAPVSQAPATQAPADTSPTETLHVSSRLVEIAAVVSAKDGVPRAGLTKDDFILKQDGKEQAIHYFSQGDALPLTLALLVDTSGSQITFLGDEARASDIFFESMLGRPQDRATLVEVNARVTQLAAMTANPNRLHLALTAMHPPKEDMVQTRLYDAIYSVATEVLGKERGRKAIILLTDGGDQGSRVPQSIAIAEAQQANIPIYSISYSAWEGFAMPMNQGLNGVRRSSGADPGMEVLKKLSESTGGRVFTVSRGSTLKQIYADIAEELRTQYEIGYTLPADVQPKQFHKLELKTKDKSLRVQARTGFYAK
jgi:Ca-activated chloride channel family protein